MLLSGYTVLDTNLNACYDEFMTVYPTVFAPLCVSVAWRVALAKNDRDPNLQR